jgi:hypothetical protein
MTITVASYLNGIPIGNKNPQKPEIITGFVEGVLRAGDSGTVATGWHPIAVDVAVVQGYVHANSTMSPHLALRKKVFDYQAARGKRSLIVDSNLFGYADMYNTNGYLRYSYDGIFPDTGEYCNDIVTPGRWEKISKDLGIGLKPWKTGGEYILIFCQRDGGWSMDGMDLMKWLLKQIKKVQARCDLPIVVRFHPGDKNSTAHKKTLLAKKIPKVTVSQNKSVIADLKRARVAVSHNSSPGVVAAIEGVPVVVLDPTRSQAATVSTHHLNSLEHPPTYDRELWIRQMAQMHWNIKEIKDGTAWKHLRKYSVL